MKILIALSISLCTLSNGLLYDMHGLPIEYIATIAYYSKAYNVPFLYAVRMVKAESNGDAKAISKNRNGTYDLGLWQLNSKYIAYFAWKYNDNKPFNVYNVQESTHVALNYIRHLYTLTGTWAGAVSAYNCGYTRWVSGDIPLSTKAYTKKIIEGKINE